MDPNDGAKLLRILRDARTVAVRVRKSNEMLKEALAALHATQNGPPLPSYEAEWLAAMDKAERLLGITGGGEG